MLQILIPHLASAGRVDEVLHLATSLQNQMIGNQTPAQEFSKSRSCFTFIYPMIKFLNVASMKDIRFQSPAQ